MLHAALFCLRPEGRWGLPLLIWGDPGRGKTAMIAAVMRALIGFEFFRVSPAERGEGQFGVVPVPGADGLLHYPPPDWTARLDQGGALFIDEVNTAGPALQAPLLGAVQLGVIGSHTLAMRVRILAAANETADAAGGWDLARSLDNRFGHVQYDGMPHDKWTLGFVTGFGRDDVPAIDAAAEEARVLAEWPAADGWARGMISGFLTRREEVRHKKPAKGDSVKAWPSDRTWEYAAAALAAARIHGLDEIETDGLMAAFVGWAAVSEFATWRHDADLPNPADYLDGRVAFEHDGRRLDRTMAFLSACAAVVRPKTAERRLERAAVCWTLVTAVSEHSASAALPAAVMLSKGGLLNVKEARPALIKLHPVLEAAGLVSKREP
jgi:MoxR-like ATPase